MEELWKRMDSWLADNAPEVLAALNPGATDEEIRAAEEAMGVTLPEDFRASYRIHNGQRHDAGGTGIFEAETFLSLERIVENWRGWKQVRDAGRFDGIQSEPEAGIRADWWNPKWIPFTHDGCGNHDCLDLDPAPDGEIGQVISMWHDDVERSILASSFREYVEQFVDDLEAGEYVLFDEYEGLVYWGDVAELVKEEAEAE